MSEDKKYSGIFKATFLFGFVQVITILIAVIKNKFIAVWIGAAGIGIYSLFNTTLTFLKTFAGFGISRSAIRDISEAYASNNEEKFSYTIALTKKLIVFTAILGTISTIILSPLLSKWTFGNQDYTYAFIALSIVTGVSIITEGQLAIVTGMRKLKSLALANVFGASVGLLISLPFIYFFKLKGIIPVLILGAISSLFFSHYLVSKISCRKVIIFFKSAIYEGREMITMGLAFVLIPILSTLANLFLASYINVTSSSAMLGYYHAGATIITSYFGVILTAMWTDYYPRLSAISNENEKIELECNKQLLVGLILFFPLMLVLLYFSNLIINILYTSDFAVCIIFLNYAIFGKLFDLGSGAVGYIILCKKEKSIFTITNTIHRVFEVVLGIICFRLWGLKGLGLSFMLICLFMFLLQVYIVKYKYNISIYLRNYIKVALITSCGILALISQHFNTMAKYITGITLLFTSITFIYYVITNEMGMNIRAFITKFFRRK